MRTRLLVGFIAGLLVCAASAQASYYVPRAHHACRTGFRREVVRVRERRHGRLVRRHGRVVRVRQVRCVTVPAKATPPAAPAPKPTVSYSARVDPTFTQSPTDALAVTYDYSADAVQTTGTQSLNLATVGQLPDGVLNLYSATVPGGPQSLFCSMNVGAAVTNGACPITYSQTGTYAVTTQYVPNGTSAVTETDQETISPFGTVTSLTVTPTACPPVYPSWLPSLAETACYDISASVVDQNGNPANAGYVSLGVGDSTAGGGAMSPGANCTVVVYLLTNAQASGSGQAGGYSPDCDTARADVSWRVVSDSDSALPIAWPLTAAYVPPSPGGTWAPSPISAVHTVTP